MKSNNLCACSLLSGDLFYNELVFITCAYLTDGSIPQHSTSEVKFSYGNPFQILSSYIIVL